MKKLVFSLLPIVILAVLSGCNNVVSSKNKVIDFGSNPDKLTEMDLVQKVEDLGSQLVPENKGLYKQLFIEGKLTDENNPLAISKTTCALIDENKAFELQKKYSGKTYYELLIMKTSVEDICPENKGKINFIIGKNGITTNVLIKEN